MAKAKTKKQGRVYEPRFQGDAPDPLVEGVAVSPETETDEAPSKAQGIETDANLIDIWERRMVNPDGIETPPIHLRTPGMRLRWINTSIPNRYHRAIYEQGWSPVQRTELKDEREIQGAQFTTEGYVTRGDRQAEMLMKIPEAIFKRIQQRRSELRDREYQKIRDNMAQAGAEHFGDRDGGSAGAQAGDIIANFKGSVKFGKERVTYGEE